ncbi:MULTISPECIES: OmpA family protein [unclassified Spirillospora]|uniref:OmpA family protein n=1 Tax=unclassified Spirillospora TaxID=2642701 RepID=UPI00371A47AD
MRRALPLAVSFSGLLLLAGCGGGGEAEKVDPPTAGVVGSARPANAGGGFAKEGWFGGADGLHARVQIKGVERQGTKSVLRYSVTSLDSSTKSVAFAIRLLDPVGRLLYRPTGSTSGDGFAPGATREMAAEYPAIPAGVEKVTVLTPGTAGEFTGVPVTGTGDAAAAASARQRGNPADLYDITEGEIKDVASSGSWVTVDLHTDVLFATGSAELSGRAKTVLDQAAQEIKAKAMSPLTFEGHTDGEGGDADNLKLSKERAEAVLKEMKSRLGDGYTYTSRGMGEAEPVAEEGGADDAKARARNRRVEITYQVKRPPAGSPSPSAIPGRGAAPAGFRADDGETVASRYGRFGEAKRRLDVKPFYRDGAYIVAVFDIVNEGPGTTPPDASYAHKDYPGGVFTSFSIQVPGDQTVYRAVRIGPASPDAAGAYADPGRAVFRTEMNQPVRGFVYVPAPSGDITSVVFNGGPFGKVDKVPVS